MLYDFLSIDYNHSWRYRNISTLCSVDTYEKLCSTMFYRVQIASEI